MNRRLWAAIATRVIVCVAVLAVGVAIMLALANMREAPAQAKTRERALRVQVQEVAFNDVSAIITSWGEVRARDVVTIAPEIPGRVVSIHPRLEVGEVIPAREVLFVIDQRDYRARLDEANAAVRLWENTVKRLKRQLDIDRGRLKTLERSKRLAAGEYERLRKLLESDSVGTQSSVDQAERAANAAADAADLLAQAVDLYPIRIEEAESSVSSMRAMAGLAEANFERTKVRAPFDARVKSVALEAGQYVQPGNNILTLANDAILEISVPLDSREARNWLRFGGAKNAGQHKRNGWFGELKQVAADIYWTEDEDRSRWSGTLHRVEKFDQQTRTLTVAVRVEGAQAGADLERSLPLVEGMFCRVDIAGRTARRVVRVPAESVGFERDASGYRSVYAAVPIEGTDELRLKTLRVRESHVDGEYVFISEGLDEGDLVIVTRLVNPLENTLLDTRGSGEGVEP